MTALVVVIVGILATGASGGPRDASSHTDGSLRSLATLYRAGDRDEAVTFVGVWGRRALEEQADRLLGTLRAEAVRGTVTQNEAEATVRAAVALLDEAAQRAIQQRDPRRARWDLTAAARLLRERPGRAAFAARFFESAGLSLHCIGDLAGAYEMFSEGRRRAPDDVGLLLGLGAVVETATALRTYESPERKPARGSRELPRFVIEGEEGAGGRLPSANLADAEAMLTRALRIDESRLEARLRLGRVLLLSGRPRDAMPELERVAREASDPAQIYMARMLEGRCRERLGDARGAAAAFSLAVERAPRAQAGLVALGRALDRLGDDKGAQAAFTAAMQPAAGPEPWLDYLGGQPARMEAASIELQSLVP